MSIYTKIKKNIKEKTFWPKIHDKVFCLVQPTFSWIFRKLPINDTKVTFDSFEGTGFGGDPKYICEELLRRNLNVKIIWFVRKYHDNFPEKVKQIKINSIRAIYHQSTAKVWIDNTRTGHRTKKRTNQKYMQTWHANVLAKKIERDAEEKLWSEYIPIAKYDGSITDAFVVANERYLEIAKSSFWLNKNVEYLKIGAPANDVLIKEKNNRELYSSIRKKLHVSEEDYIILYAPSFRDDGSTKGYSIDIEKVRSEFEVLTGKNCIILVRFHPDVAQHENLVKYSENTRSATRYTDVKELSLASDCLITDYSSVVYDFLLLRKPIFRLCLDFEDYKAIRDVYDDFYNMPYTLSFTNKELISSISSFNETNYQNRLDEYFEFNHIFDNGCASALATEWIIDKLRTDGGK